MRNWCGNAAHLPPHIIIIFTISHPTASNGFVSRNEIGLGLVSRQLGLTASRGFICRADRTPTLEVASRRTASRKHVRANVCIESVKRRRHLCVEKLYS